MRTKINKNFPMVSIVTINWNQFKVTSELLNSLEKVTYPNFEVIVVDNASKETNPQKLKLEYPFIRLFINEKNEGFTGGNNRGILESNGKYILLLNNDTEVDKDFLFPMVEKLESSEYIGIVSSKIVYFHTPGLIQYAGSTRINPYTLTGKFVGHREFDQGQHNKPMKTEYAHGASMMIKRKVIDKIGMLDNLFFIYYEELDFCERAKKVGYSIHYVPDSVVYHKESVSIGKESTLKTYYMTRNRLIYARKHIYGLKLICSFAYVLLLSAPKNIIKFIISLKFDLLKAYLKGILWHLYNLDFNVNKVSLED